MKNLRMLAAALLVAWGSTASSSPCTDTTCPITGFGSTQRALWLPDLPFGIHQNFEFDENGGLFEVFPDGTARITGVCINMQNPNYGFIMDFHFRERRNWDEWSALGRSWKGQASIVGQNYLDWDYYIMDDTQSNTLVGIGDLEGSLLNVTHNPTNYYYGLQVGIAANDKNNQPGMSFWFNVEGTINGQSFNGHGDINLEGVCEEINVLECPSDLSVSCEEGASAPELTGIPVIECQEPWTLDWSDEVIGEGCAYTIIRTFTATSATGESVSCQQTISVADTTAPVIGNLPVVVNDCDFMALIEGAVSDNCFDSTSLDVNLVATNAVSDEEGCDPGQLRTQTIGGWGAPANGNNPGAYRDANFDAAFPNGLTIGCGANTLTLTSAAAVEAWLPSGGSPGILPAGSTVDPTAYTNTFASQLVGITLSLGFDAYDPSFGQSDFALSDVIYTSGSFAGMSLSDVVAIANEVIGGCSSAYSVSQLNTALTTANENYVDGTQNNGNFGCGLPIECGASFDVVITATDACGNSSSVNHTFYIDGGQAPAFINPPADLTVECGEVPAAEIEFEGGCFSELYTLEVSETEFSGTCSPTIQRTFTLTGPCGSVTQHVQYIVVVDTTAPVLSNVPADVTIGCDDLVPDAEPTATDNCGILDVVLTENVQTTACGEVIVRVWTAHDFCGNSATAMQTIVREPQGGPSVVYAPANLALSCGSELPVDAPEFANGCSGEIDVVFTESQEGDACNQLIVRTWLATDACGNSTEVVQTIALTDNQAPEFVFVPANQSLACGTPLANLENAVAADNCSAVSVTVTENWSNGPASCGVLTRVFTALDACGNAAVAVQTITFVDDEAPVLSGVPQGGEGCELAAAVPVVTAFDACSGEVEVEFTETSSVVNCEVTLTRVWTATDACGNSASAEQIITYLDAAVPVITGLPSVAIECGALTDFGLIEVADDCTAGLNLSFTDDIDVQSSGCDFTFTRNYVVVDGCGNEATFTQVIALNDESGPVFTFVPEDLVIGCEDAFPAPNAEAEDNCSLVTITVDDSIASNGCGDQLTRVYTATDDCGNSTTHTQTISRVDETAPVFVFFPEDRTIDCGSSYPPLETPVATDNCGAVQLTLEELEVANGCAGDALLRVWTATDACGNTATATQTIARVDNAPPVFGALPGDTVADCGAIPAPANVTATDNCSAVNIEFIEYTDSGGCPNIYRMWTATDACGNSASHLQTIVLNDTEPPVLTGIPPSTTASCNSLPPLPEPDASDNCDDNVSVTFVETVVGSGCSFTLIRTWIASDDCGNTTVVSQSIVVEDTEDPVFVNVPPVQTVECGALGALPLPTVTDDCGNTVTVTFQDQVLGSGCNYQINRTYTATDLCGNTATATTVINVVDNTPPSIFGVGPNTMVQCGAIPMPNAAFAVDACSGAATISVVDTPIGGGCSYIINRTYTATDACGNQAALTQLIFVSDFSAPVLSQVPANATIGCNDPMPAVAQVNAFDACAGQVPVSFTENTVVNGCSEVTTRVWTAADNCGNSTSATQTITRIDQDAPVFVGLPQDATVSCDAIPAAVTVTATDACGSASVAMTEQVITGGCPYEIRRTYTATDLCGNTAQHIQRIFVIDNEAPVLEGDFTTVFVGCGEVPELPAVSATDNCANPQVLFEEEWGAPGCVQLLTRTWTAIDLCGNTTVAVQQIFIEDQSAPVFTTVPENITTNCLMVQPMQPLQAVDACGEVTLTMDEFIAETACASEYTITRAWTATDACGNATTVVQEVNVIDDVAPILIQTEEDLTVGCGDVPEPADVQVLSACGEEVVLTYTEQIIEDADGVSDCPVGNSTGFSGDLALWLPGIDGIHDMYVYGPEGGVFTQNELTGEAFLTGQVYNTQNPAFSWFIELALHEARNWDEWSALGRDYKDDLGIATDFHQDWTYFVLNGATSRLIGAGDFEGSELTLSHAPADTLYGFQLGINANNHSEGFGLGGWFFYDGLLLGQPVSGHGDFFTLQDCCPAQQIIRTWTAVDCAGNTTVHVQNIFVEPGFGIEPYQLMVDDSRNSGALDVRNSTGDVFTIQVEADFTGQARLELFDSYGQRMAIIREWPMIDGASYTFSYPKAALPSGMYIFALTGEQKLHTDKELVTR